MTYKPTRQILRHVFEQLPGLGARSRVIQSWLLALWVLLVVSFFRPHATYAAIIVTPLPGGQAHAVADGIFGPVDEQRTLSAGLSGSVSASTTGASANAFWSITSQGATFGTKATGTLGVATSRAYTEIRYSLASTTNGPIRFRPTGFGCINTYVDAYGGPYEQSGSAVWTYGDYFPGEPENPKGYDGPGIYVPEGDDEPDVKRGAITANDTTGDYLTSLPVEDSYGVTAPVYFGNQPAALALAASDNPSPNVVGYYFSSWAMLLSVPSSLLTASPARGARYRLVSGTCRSPIYQARLTRSVRQ